MLFSRSGDVSAPCPRGFRAAPRSPCASSPPSRATARSPAAPQATRRAPPSVGAEARKPASPSPASAFATERCAGSRPRREASPGAPSCATGCGRWSSTILQTAPDFGNPRASRVLRETPPALRLPHPHASRSPTGRPNTPPSGTGSRAVRTRVRRPPAPTQPARRRPSPRQFNRIDTVEADLVETPVPVSRSVKTNRACEGRHRGPRSCDTPDRLRPVHSTAGAAERRRPSPRSTDFRGASDPHPGARSFLSPSLKDPWGASIVTELDGAPRVFPDTGPKRTMCSVQRWPFGCAHDPTPRTSRPMLRYHRQLLSDAHRTESFGRAVAEVVRPGDVVLDLGADRASWP